MSILRRVFPFIIVTVIGLTVGAFLIEAIRKAKETAGRTQTINNFKQISLSVHNFHDQYKVLPTPVTIRDDGGRKREVPLSWRYAIVPFIESSPLFTQFDHTVGWDHPRNAGLQSEMTIVFTCPHLRETDPPAMTRFQYFTGPNAMYPANVPLALADIKDGTSRTFLFAEGDQPVIWTKPVDMAIRPDQPLPLPEDLFFAAMADASVRMIIRERTSDTILRQLIDPNDQQPGDGWDH